MARRSRRRKNNNSLVILLLDSPWQASIGVGIAAYVGLRWVFPVLAGNNFILSAVAAALSGVAWLVAGMFFVLGLLAYMKTAARKNESRHIEPAVGGVAVDRLGRVEPSDLAARGEVRAGSWVRLDADDGGGALRASPPLPAKPAAWSLNLIRELEWKRFEDVCQQFYEKKGIRSETTPLGPDGGIDIRLYQDDSGRATSIVQCKAWGERLVGVKPVRELLGVMTHEKIGKAFFMTSGGYSAEAKAVAQANHITLIDGAMLLMMIERLPSVERASLLAFATAGDYATPTCPSCGVKMRATKGKGGRPNFWGCPQYPRCRQVLGMRGAQWGGAESA